MGVLTAARARAHEDVEPADLRDHQVEHHEGGRVRGHRVERRPSVRGLRHPVPVALQVRPHQAHDLGIVIDDQDRARIEGGHRVIVGDRVTCP